MGKKLKDLKFELEKDGRARENTADLTERMKVLDANVDYQQDHDKYSNGPMRDRLSERYDPSTSANGDLYPSIKRSWRGSMTSTLGQMAMPVMPVSSAMCFEEDHGNVYFTFEFV